MLPVAVYKVYTRRKSVIEIKLPGYPIEVRAEWR